MLYNLMMCIHTRKDQRVAYSQFDLLYSTSETSKSYLGDSYPVLQDFHLLNKFMFPGKDDPTLRYVTEAVIFRSALLL